jgi:hypothetical protein
LDNCKEEKQFFTDFPKQSMGKSTRHEHEARPVWWVTPPTLFRSVKTSQAFPGKLSDRPLNTDNEPLKLQNYLNV